MLGFSPLSQEPLSSIPTSTPSTPLTETLVDNFDDNSRDVAKWNKTEAQGTVDETGGRLEIAPTGISFGYSSYSAVNIYDLTDSSVLVNMVQAVSGNTGFEGGMSVRGGGNEIALFRGGGALVCRYAIGGSNNDTYPSWNSAYTWLRIREESGTTYWETSPDGTTWTTRRSVATPITITSLTPTLFAGQYQAVASPITAIFDNFNIAPSGSTTGQIKYYNGTTFVAKPVKVWNGTAWVVKPLKRWNGSAWITTTY
jgi:hypothetical protein